MTDRAEYMRPPSLFIDGIAQGFAIQGKGFIGVGIAGIPSLQSTIQLFGIHASQYLADDVAARDEVTAVTVAATETGAGFLTEILGPEANVINLRHK